MSTVKVRTRKRIIEITGNGHNKPLYRERGAFYFKYLGELHCLDDLIPIQQHLEHYPKWKHDFDFELPLSADTGLLVKMDYGGVFKVYRYNIYTKQKQRHRVQ